MVKDLTKDSFIELIQDFENSDWSWHHIRYIDNMLHTKYKEKECEEFSYKD